MRTMSEDFLTTYRKPLVRLIQSALEEDLGEGDHSGNACVEATEKHKAQLLVKEDCVLAGVSMAKLIFELYDPSISVNLHHHDGENVSKGAIAFEIVGPSRSLLATERLVLNCMQRMSGIATLTRELSNKISHTQCRLLDTRKTTPNFRHAEKWAVTIGGGTNHRMGLYDELMIKDNHIDYNGSLKETLAKVKTYLEQINKNLAVVVEIRNLEELETCLQFPWIHRLLLDNMNAEQLQKALHINAGQFSTEASGNITAETLVEIAETGVDYISMGALTHSARNIDLSLKAAP